MMDGMGKMEFDDKKLIYEGDFKNGVMEGYGKMFFSNGMVYDGEWQDDQMVGQGILSFPDGKVVRGVWNECDLIEGELIHNDALEEAKDEAKTSIASYKDTFLRSSIGTFPRPSQELQELLRNRLRPYASIIGKSNLKTQEKVPDARFEDSKKHEPFRQAKPQFVAKTLLTT